MSRQNTPQSLNFSHFAKIFEIDGQQVVFQVHPLEEGRFEVSTSVDLGWCRYGKIVELSLTQPSLDPVGQLLEQITTERAKADLKEAVDQWGEAAMLSKMPPEDAAKHIHIPPAEFAKLVEIDGLQILATQSTPNEDEVKVLQNFEETVNEDSKILRVTIGDNDGKAPTSFLLLDEDKSMFGAFNISHAQQFLKQAQSRKPNPQPPSEASHKDRKRTLH